MSSDSDILEPQTAKLSVSQTEESTKLSSQKLAEKTNNDHSTHSRLEDTHDVTDTQNQSLELLENDTSHTSLVSELEKLSKTDSNQESTTDISLEKFIGLDDTKNNSDLTFQRNTSQQISDTLSFQLHSEHSQNSLGMSLDESKSEESYKEDDYNPDNIDSHNIDRNMYYELYSVFKKQHRSEKFENNFLHSRLANYYQRRKMMYVLREQTLHVAELQNKYEKELDALEQLTETSDREKEWNLSEINTLKNRCNTKATELEEKFDKFQKSLLEYGNSLTFDKTGKSNMDKVTERFLKRQKTQVALVQKLRLYHIQLRNKISEKMRALDELDNLGPGFRIMDYVQLKIDNRELQDKLEEKESELTMLRKSCQNTMQILAHNREKTSVADLDKGKLEEELETADLEVGDAREQLYYLKQERDDYRHEIKQLKQKFGLLTNRKLIKDMEKSITEVDYLKKKLSNIQAEYNEKSKQLAAVRKNIDYALRNKQKAERKTVKGAPSSSSSGSEQNVNN